MKLKLSLVPPKVNANIKILNGLNRAFLNQGSFIIFSFLIDFSSSYSHQFFGLVYSS